MSEIMNIIYEREKQKTKTERNKGVMQAIGKVWELNDFVVCLSFLQLICKTSLIFNSDLELALSIILTERELYESKHVVEKCRCLKMWDLLFFLIYSSILALKWRVLPMQLELS